MKVDRGVNNKQRVGFLHRGTPFPAAQCVSLASSREIHIPPSNSKGGENKDRIPNTAQLPKDMVSTISTTALSGNSNGLKLDGLGRHNSTTEDTVENASIPRRIYILGTENVGKLVAHSLANIPSRPPITFLLHHQGVVNQWYRGGKSIEIIQHGTAERSSGFDIELTMPHDQAAPSHPQMHSTIHSLVVSVKAPATVEALSTIAHRLGRESTVLFVNDGMGILDEVNENLFTDPETRPEYIVGVSTHGLRTLSPFSSAHYGIGTIGLGLVPQHDFRYSEQTSPILSPSARYLLRTLTRTPTLAAMGLTASDIHQLQLEKLVSQATIDTLTVMFDCKNGNLLDNFGVTRVMRLLLSEISLVIRSLPELQGIPNLDLRFSPSRLEYQIVSLAKSTAFNDSSMLQAVKHGRITDIDYSTGYIVRRGEELGIRCVMNYMLMQMVKGKQNMESRKIEGRLPIEPAELPSIGRKTSSKP
ncbi:hypothetical protein MMC11_007117 [Xylographa trunciseda]|nr:hypothetical protein [Xylographa trunciseda]